MSASFALIRFRKTGRIYHGCYDGTSDAMNPHICTPQECWNEKTGSYCSIGYCRELANTRGGMIFPNDVGDLDECEIYSDYGSGFYWTAVGSESLKMVDSPVNEYGELNFSKITEGIPEWANRYINVLEQMDCCI